MLITLFIGCLFKMPYGYYQWFIISAFILFVWLAYDIRQTEKDKKGGIVYLLLARSIIT